MVILDSADQKTLVVVLGASPNPERYSNKALRLLKTQGFEPIPVNPGHQLIEGLPSVKALSDITEFPIHTLTIYLNSNHVSSMIDQILNLRPGRVIVNPGAESELLKTSCEQVSIPYLEACTLVLLRTQQF